MVHIFILTYLIQQILENLFKLLPLETLKECRLVSTLWNKEAYKQVQKEAWITITHDENFKHGLINFFNFVESCYTSPTDILFQNFQLKYINLLVAEADSTQTSRISDFWTQYGSQIKTLHLKRCCIEKDMLGKIISSAWTPNLENLILDECPFMNSPTGLPNYSYNINRIQSLKFQSDKSDHSQPFEPALLWSMFPQLTVIILIKLSVTCYFS